MAAVRQGAFTEIHNQFFGAIEGGYTAITNAEIYKSTFNVKVSMRNVLIERIGYNNIPSINSEESKMDFHVWPGTKEATKGDVSFICKFSKPDKDEMSAYFVKIVPKDRMEDGDIWFIFFREGDPTPWFGFIKKSLWDHFFGQSDLGAEYESLPSEEIQHDVVGTSTVAGAYNLILYGAPGTGKSFELEKKSSGCITRVVFHSEYTYYDFVGSYKPVPIYTEETSTFIEADRTPIESGQPYIDYQFVPGPFAIALKDALIKRDEMHTLIIEELNRANAAAVFGDIFQLLDRKKDGESEYRIIPTRELYNYLKRNVPTLGTDIYIPSNLNIFATMNSADQGVFVMDSAFKRRWNFEYMPIKLSGIEHENELVYYFGGKIPWKIFVESINNRLADIKINEDKHIGPYFMKQGEPSDRHKIGSKLLVYLWDDVVRHCRSQFFLAELKTFAQLVMAYNNDEKIFVFDIKQIEGDAFIPNEDNIFSSVKEKAVEYPKKVAESGPPYE